MRSVLACHEALVSKRQPLLYHSAIDAMTTAQEVICLAADSKTAVADVLRKCLVLAYELDNDALKLWVDSELNGYSSPDDLPEYRRINITAKGLFIGPMAHSIPNQPLASHVLSDEHRPWAERANLTQPVASYEQFLGERTDRGGNLKIEWPATLTTIYQTKFFDHYVLNRAWQEIPLSAAIGVVDIVRNKALKFALELQKALGPVKDDVAALPREKVDQIVSNYIFGSNVVIAGHAHNFTQTHIAEGDKTSLLAALSTLGVSDINSAELLEAVREDRREDSKATTLGDRTLKAIGKLATSGAKVGVEIAKPVLTSMLTQYLGLPPG